MYVYMRMRRIKLRIKDIIIRTESSSTENISDNNADPLGELKSYNFENQTRSGNSLKNCTSYSKINILYYNTIR